MIKYFDLLIARGLVKLIGFYQKTISPDHGVFSSKHPLGFCRFRPTCSEYAILALSKKGFLRAMPFILIRLLKCNPWNKGGYDPLS
jgi:uncharacterized protein